MNSVSRYSMPPNKKKNVILSCAECRRLKLKCSREFPCANCVKKGCEAICPDGSLTTGKGNRFVLANTEFLHDKINTLSTRIRQLEDALEESHAHYSTEPHHLLTPELRALKKPLEKGTENDLLGIRNGGLPTNSDLHDRDTEETNEIIDAVGSLSMVQPDRINYHGSSANSLYLLKNEDKEEEEEEEEEIDETLPVCVPWLSYSFPFSPSTTHSSRAIRTEILYCLPERQEARELCGAYFQFGAWMYTPVVEAEFMEEVFDLFYGNMSSDQDPLESHKLGLLFLVFAMGKLLDHRLRQIESQEALKYYQIGRAALTINSFLEAKSIPALQALVVMCHFMFLANVENARWMVMGMVVKLTQSVGLHRDGAKFNMGPEETHKRRALMWEIYTYDSWQSLTFGRPNSFPVSSIDCEMAHDTTRNEHGELEMSFAAWKHRFSSQCLSVVHEQAFGARTPNYKVIQDLDKKVRGFYIPPSLHIPGFGGKSKAAPAVELERPSLQLSMQRYVAWSIKEITIFYMHRGYFARSVEENKDDPLSGKYGSSVLAVHGSACTFIMLIKSMYSQHPGLAERMWFFFTHVFSCSIVLGSIAAKCPGMNISPSALHNLNSACTLFEGVSHHPRASKILPLLKKLRERATISMSDYQSRKSLLPRLTMESSIVRDDIDELVGGKARLVQKATSPSSSHAGTESLPSSSPRARSHTTSPPPLSAFSDAGSAATSPMAVWEVNYGHHSNNQQTQFQPMTNNQYHSDTSSNTWYNGAGPTQPSQTMYQYPIQQIPSLQQQQEISYMNMDISPSEPNMFGRDISSNGSVMIPYSQAQPSINPTNEVQSYWQQFLLQQLAAGY